MNKMVWKKSVISYPEAVLGRSKFYGFRTRKFISNFKFEVEKGEAGELNCPLRLEVFLLRSKCEHFELPFRALRRGTPSDHVAKFFLRNK
jgi:hypothetical protein